MGCGKQCWVVMILVLALVSVGHAETYDLQYFLTKASSKEGELTKRERTELLDRVEATMGQTQRVHRKLTEAIQGGELDIRYQEGKFWMSKFEQDRGSIESGLQQLQMLKEKPTNLASSIKLYKALKDLSSNFNTYNNKESFSSWVGDLAPEIELWADPIFYRLYLLPLAQSKDAEKKPAPKENPQKEKSAPTKGKKP